MYTLKTNRRDFLKGILAGIFGALLTWAGSLKAEAKTPYTDDMLCVSLDDLPDDAYTVEGWYTDDTEIGFRVDGRDTIFSPIEHIGEAQWKHYPLYRVRPTLDDGRMHSITYFWDGGHDAFYIDGVEDSDPTPLEAQLMGRQQDLYDLPGCETTVVENDQGDVVAVDTTFWRPK